MSTEPWQPEANPTLMKSTSYRYRILRTAHGYGLYDYALGTRVGFYLTLKKAVAQKRIEVTMMRMTRPNNGDVMP